MSSQSSFGRNAFGGSLHGLSSSQGLGGQGGGGLQGMSSLNAASLNSGMPSSQGQHGPAIESLTITAQSVGLSIEQLAAALSSSPNLKALSAENGGNKDGHQKDLALSLYRTESLALYRRCMLLAGFDVGAIEETSPEYLQFAFKAWQEEGKRLQDLMGTEMSLQAPVVANLSLQQQQQEAAQAQAHAQVQAQVQAQAVQAQAQALALEQQQQKQQLLLQNRLQQQHNSGLKSLLYNQQRLSGIQLLNNNKGNQFL